MRFEANNLYYIFNQGNNRQQIFFSNDNYLYFLKLYRHFVSPFADTVAWCLMPNHFHFLLYTNKTSVEKIKVGSLHLTNLSNGIRTLLSGYAAAINKQQNASGSLFRQKTKAECIAYAKNDYAREVFHYIHLNPLEAKLVSQLNCWEYSSFQDYLGLRNGNLINKEIAARLIDINWKSFEKDTLEVFEHRSNNR